MLFCAPVGIFAQSPTSERLKIDVLQKQAEDAFAANDTSVWSITRALLLKTASYGTQEQKMNAFRVQGELYRDRSEYLPAIQHFIQALSIAEQLNNAVAIGHLNRLAGISYRMMEDFSKARTFYDRSLAAYLQTADSSAVMNALNNLASIHFLEKDLMQAELYVSKQLEMATRQKDPYWETSALRLRGLIALERGQMADAIRYQEDALKMVREMNAPDRLLLGLTGLQLTFFRAGLLKEGLKLGYEAIELAEQDSNFVSLETAYEHQAMLFEKQGRLDSAFWALKKRLYYRDRAISTERMRSAADIQARYELGRKESAIENLKQQNHLQEKLLANQRWLQYVLIGLIFVSAAFFALMYSRYRYKRRTEAELRRSNEKLAHALEEARTARHEAEQASQLKTELLGIAAHDLKSPLSAISGLSEVLETEIPEKEDMVRIAGQIRKSSARMLRLVVDLLHTAAEDAGRLELRRSRINLKEVLETSVAAFQDEARRKRQAILMTAKKDVFIHADAERLLEVFDNLISNAVKYSPISGTIQIRLKEPEFEGDFATVLIKDSGPGILQEDMPRLFQRFNRLSALPTGGETSTGLGLSIVKKLVEMHIGEVYAESEGKGLGAVFVVKLPV